MPPKVLLNLRVTLEEKEELREEAERRGGKDAGVDLSDIARERMRNGKKFEMLRDLLPKSQWLAIQKILEKKLK